jgi:hypothetical protein
VVFCSLIGRKVSKETTVSIIRLKSFDDSGDRNLKQIQCLHFGANKEFGIEL